MGDVATSQLLQQLPYHVPHLLLYLVGLALAFVTYRKHRLPSLLVLIAMVFLIVVTIAFALIQAQLFQKRFEEDWNPAQFARALTIVGIASSICRAIGVALILTAVFVGRRPSK